MADLAKQQRGTVTFSQTEVAAVTSGLVGFSMAKLICGADVAHCMSLMRHCVARRLGLQQSLCGHRNLLPMVPLGVTVKCYGPAQNVGQLVLENPSSKHILSAGVTLILFLVHHMKDPFYLSRLLAKY